MKIIPFKKGEFNCSINFVDDNDVLVGYDLAQDCCEHAGWFIEGGDKLVIEDETVDLSGYEFDKGFFEEWYPLMARHGEAESLDAGGVAVFRMTNSDYASDRPFGHEAYLVLFNSHNGYYGHGFEVKHGGEVVRQGDL